MLSVFIANIASICQTKKLWQLSLKQPSIKQTAPVSGSVYRTPFHEHRDQVTYCNLPFTAIVFANENGLCSFNSSFSVFFFFFPMYYACFKTSFHWKENTIKSRHLTSLCPISRLHVDLIMEPALLHYGKPKQCIV